MSNQPRKRSRKQSKGKKSPAKPKPDVDSEPEYFEYDAILNNRWDNKAKEYYFQV